MGSEENIKQKIITLLEKLHPAMSTLQDDFFVIGSSALILSDIPMINHTEDIDLLTSSRDADQLKELLKHNRIDYKPTETARFKSNFARFGFDELDLEVMGDLEVYIKGQWRKVKVDRFKEIPVGQSKIKIPTLAEKVRILQLFGRQKDIDKVTLLKKMM